LPTGSEFVRGIQGADDLHYHHTKHDHHRQIANITIQDIKYHDQEQTAKPMPNNKKKNLESNSKKIINSQEKGSILKLK
jgi:hypothetical protein